MAYSAPELRLVGAAQQLVLNGSEVNGLKEIQDLGCDGIAAEDGQREEYDLPAGW